MKDKVLHLIERHISMAENDARRARFQFSKVNEPYLDKEYCGSGKTCRDLLAGYERKLKEAHDMKAWFLGVVG